MKKLSLVALALLLLIGATSVAYSLGNGHTSAVQAAPAVSTPSIYELWQLTNVERSKAGVAALVLDPRLDQSAQAKCTAMAAENDWQHQLKDGRRADSFIAAAGVSSKKWAENLTTGYNTSPEVIHAWMTSTHGHRETLLNPDYDEVGFAICNAPKYRNIVVQHFVDD